MLKLSTVFENSYYYAHFIAEEMDGRKDKATYPKWHIQSPA